MNVTLLYSGTLTVQADNDQRAIREALMELPPGANVEIVGREKEPPVRPTEILTKSNQDTLRVLDGAGRDCPLKGQPDYVSEPNKFPVGRWGDGGRNAPK